MREEGTDGFVFEVMFTVSGVSGGPTLITVDSIFPALAGLTGRPIEAFVTLTESGPVGPVHAESVPEAGLTLRPGTRLTVLPEKPSTTPPHLETEELASYCRLCLVFYFSF